jgi:hypothetical protein
MDLALKRNQVLSVFFVSFRDSKRIFTPLRLNRKRSQVWKKNCLANKSLWNEGTFKADMQTPPPKKKKIY